MSASKNMVRHGLEARKTCFVAFYLLPHFPVQITAQLALGSETLLNCSDLTFVEENPLIRG